MTARLEGNGHRTTNMATNTASRSLARALAANGIHYGWLMVGLTFLLGMCLAGAMSIPGILLKPMSDDFGWIERAPDCQQ